MAACVARLLRGAHSGEGAPPGTRPIQPGFGSSAHAPQPTIWHRNSDGCLRPEGGQWAHRDKHHEVFRQRCSTYWYYPHASCSSARLLQCVTWKYLQHGMGSTGANMSERPHGAFTTCIGEQRAPLLMTTAPTHSRAFSLLAFHLLGCCRCGTNAEVQPTNLTCSAPRGQMRQDGMLSWTRRRVDAIPPVRHNAMRPLQHVCPLPLHILAAIFIESPHDSVVVLE